MGLIIMMGRWISRMQMIILLFHVSLCLFVSERETDGAR